MHISRGELYSAVWTKPIQKLAAELGLSDVGLAKVCRRESIPVPPRGYWQKLAAGSVLASLSYRTGVEMAS